jgi:hypothetical protein
MGPGWRQGEMVWKANVISTMAARIKNSAKSRGRFVISDLLWLMVDDGPWTIAISLFFCPIVLLFSQ